MQIVLSTFSKPSWPVQIADAGFRFSYASNASGDLSVAETYSVHGHHRTPGGLQQVHHCSNPP